MPAVAEDREHTPPSTSLARAWTDLSPTIDGGGARHRFGPSDLLRLEGGARAFQDREQRYGFRDRFAPAQR